MKSLDVANCMVDRYGSDIPLTNLKLNKLVYFAQVLSLKETGIPLFDDAIQAWDYGPVEPMVYRNFKNYGSGRIINAGEYHHGKRLEETVDAVVRSLGMLTAFDLVRLSHRDGGAWKHAFRPHENIAISDEMIIDSSDMSVFDDTGSTLSAGISVVSKKWPNALRMLENT